MFSAFRGGVHPPQRKITTENSGIENLSVPQVCHIPMRQYASGVAVPVVKTGDIVKEGQLIGRGCGELSADVHASVPGRVIEISDYMTVYDRQTTVVIEAEGAFTSSGSSILNDWEKSDRAALLDLVIGSGIAGRDLIGLSSAIKNNQPEIKKNGVLIVNGTESEPYLTAEDMQLRTYPSEIIEGTRIAMKILGVSRGIIAIEENKKSTVRGLRDALKKLQPADDVSIKTLQSKYPVGAEKQLIYGVLKRALAPGTRPAESGVYVLGSGTIYSVRDAVLYNRPVIERCVTVSGSMIKRPGNYKVRVGTMISGIVEECGGLKGQPYRIVIGGPMSGISVDTTDIPLTKSASGILFLSEDEAGKGEYNPCVRCGRCVSVCPMGLVPCEIAGAVERERFDIAGSLHAGLCIMCSCCSYICPSGRPLSFLVNSAGKYLSGQK